MRNSPKFYTITSVKMAFSVAVIACTVKLCNQSDPWIHRLGVWNVCTSLLPCLAPQNSHTFKMQTLYLISVIQWKHYTSSCSAALLHTQNLQLWTSKYYRQYI